MANLGAGSDWPYFAYGSNLGVSRLRCRCPNARQVGIAKVLDYRIRFTRHSRRQRGGVADLVPAIGGIVWGALFDIGDDGFGELDRHEGVPTAYRREVWELTTADCSSVRACVYIVASKQTEVLPSYDYWRAIVDGAKEAELPADYVAYLEGLDHGAR